MNEQQAKVYFGWAADSDMLVRYAHLLASDANEALLRSHQTRALPRDRSEDERDRLISYLIRRLEGQSSIVEAGVEPSMSHSRIERPMLIMNSPSLR